MAISSRSARTGSRTAEQDEAKQRILEATRPAKDQADDSHGGELEP